MMDASQNSPVSALRDKLSKSRRQREDSASTDTASIASKFKSKMNKTMKKAEGLGIGSSEDLRGRPRESDTPAPPGIGESQSSLDVTSYSSEEDVPSKPSSAAPFLLSQDSQVSSMTTSSAEVDAMPVSSSAPANQTQASASPRLNPLAHASTLPSASRSPSIASSNGPSEPVTQESLSRSTTLGSRLRESRKSSQGRAVSPGLRIKEALKPSPSGRSNQDDGKDSPSPSPGLGAFFSKDRSGSIASRRAQRSSDTPPVPASIQTSNPPAAQSNASLPAIVTVPDTPKTGNSMSQEASKAPATTVTPPTPVDGRVDRPVTSAGKLDSPTRASARKSIATQPSAHQLAAPQPAIHRRALSDTTTHQPSKLSRAATPPLTPLEEVKTPGSTKTSAGNPIPLSGFFSSVFSAAQNTANTITNTLGTNPPKPRPVTPQSQQTKEGESSKLPTPPETGRPPGPDRPMSAIETIGSGNLSLSHLGISHEGSTLSDSAIPDTVTKIDNSITRKRSSTLTKREEAAAKEEGASAARAVSAAYESGPPVLPGTTPVAEDVSPTVKPSSLYDGSIASDRTPPDGSVFDGEAGSLFHSSSLRSKVEKTKQRRHRNSSVSNATVAHVDPAVAAIAPRVTGFAVANNKRNKDFHTLFKSVPENDYLIEDYSCALQRDILLAGRIYITEGHICFSSNILGWVTTLVISFDEVVSVEKENTAMVFPNAIAIQTLHARHTIRSLLNRETTYELMIGIWKISHPGLQSSENGVRLVNGGTGSKTEKVEAEFSDDGSAGSKANGEIYDEDEDEDEESGDEIEVEYSRPATRENSIAGSEAAQSPPKPPGSAKPAAVGQAIGQSLASPPTLSEPKAAQKAAALASATPDFPGPAQHAPTECSDSATHYEKLLKDEVVPAPLGKVFSMVFGALSGGFMSRWLLDEVKVTELEMSNDKKGLTDGNTSRSYSYIKPLNSSVGPKSTKCIITEQLDAFDLEKAASVTVTTQTPDVPSGNVFSTKTRYCFMWGPNNGTRVIMSSVIEWTGKSWLKGPIERGAADGQQQYANDLMKALRAGVSARPRTGTAGSKLKKGRKRKAADGDSLLSPSAAAAGAIARAENWGLFEPLRPSMGPIVDICRPLFTAQSLVGLLLVLLIMSWFRNSRARYSQAPSTPHSRGILGRGGSFEERITAYEQMWQEEEEALWDWLDERVGLPDELASAVRGAGMGLGKGRLHTGTKGTGKGHKSMRDRELEHAIDVTEQKLRTLRNSINRKSGARDAERTEGTPDPTAEAELDDKHEEL